MECGKHPTLIKVLEWMRARLEILTARMEEVDEKQEDAIFRENQSIEKVLIDGRDVDMLDRLAEADSNPGEEDWMGEFIDL